jgi:hypothetical protein
VWRFDVDGNAVDAHDGSILQVGDVYYLYGTSYSCGYIYEQNSNFCGYKVYSSPDLRHWTDRGYIVEPGQCAVCFRPHVVYNAATLTYVMWADMGIGSGYGVFTSPSPTGPFTRKPNSTLAYGGAVDGTLFVDTDGTGYVIHNTTLNLPAGMTADMAVEKLTPDYLTTTGQAVRLGLGNVEAFAAFKRDGVYHVLMSDPTCAYCAGATGEVTATSMLGAWSGIWNDPNAVNIYAGGTPQPRNRGRIVNADNCGGQPLAVLPVTHGTGGTDYYFVSDRWTSNLPAGANRNQGLADADPYAGGSESYSITTGAGFTAEPARDLKFTTDVRTAPAPVPGDLPAGYARCADEGSACSFTGTRVVAYGAGSYRYKTVTGGTACGVAAFGGDPVFGVLKSCYVAPAGGPAGYTQCAAQGATCAFTGTKLVAFGANGAFAYRLASNGTACDPATFGRDPIDGAKACYTTSTAAPAGNWQLCAADGAACAVSGPQTILYGAGGAYHGRQVNGSVTCTAANFGGSPTADPGNACFRQVGGPVGFGTVCAGESGTCSFTGFRTVAYGAAGRYVYKSFSGTAPCNPTAFGLDPIFGVVKSCYLTP